MASSDQPKIRVKLRAFDHRVIDETANKIIQTALVSGAKVVGPVPLPTKKRSIVVLKSPHTDKNARDRFEIRSHKRLIDIILPTNKTIDSLQHLDLPAGVDIQIKM
jgi:small subunit ribosomal protein S10